LLLEWIQHQNDHDVEANKKKGVARDKMIQQFEKKSVGEFEVGKRVLIRNPMLFTMLKKPLGVERYSYPAKIISVLPHKMVEIQIEDTDETLKIVTSNLKIIPADMVFNSPTSKFFSPENYRSASQKRKQSMES